MGAEEEVGRLRERRLDAGFAADRQVNNLQRQLDRISGGENDKS